MKIILSPVAAIPGTPDDTVSVSGDIVTVNGTAYDLSAVPEGGEAKAEGDHPFTGPITRDDGVLSVPLRYHYRAATVASINQSANLADWIVDITAGELTDPIARITDIPRVSQKGAVE